MILFQYTLLFFALLSVSIAAPVPGGDDVAVNHSRKPPMVFDHTDGSLGWVYYASSSIWGQKNGVVPVVVIGPPRSGAVVVVEITWNMDYLREANPTEKKHASGFFETGTMLSTPSIESKGVKFHSLDDAWINVAKPRIIGIGDMWWKSRQASARMQVHHLLTFVPLLKPIMHLSINPSQNLAGMPINEIEELIKKDSGIRWGSRTIA